MTSEIDVKVGTLSLSITETRRELEHLGYCYVDLLNEINKLEVSTVRELSKERKDLVDAYKEISQKFKKHNIILSSLKDILDLMSTNDSHYYISFC